MIFNLVPSINGSQCKKIKLPTISTTLKENLVYPSFSLRRLSHHSLSSSIFNLISTPLPSFFFSMIISTLLLLFFFSQSIISLFFDPSSIFSLNLPSSNVHRTDLCSSTFFFILCVPMPSIFFFVMICSSHGL